jgi:hypothetical protein
VGPSLNRGFVAFEPGFYSGYTVERTQGAVTDTIAFAVPDRLENQWGGGIGVTTPTFRSFTASANVSTGEGAIFAEAVPGRALSLSASVDWRPASQVRVSAQWTRRTIARQRDDSRFSTEAIPRLKVEYQASRAIFLRFVGQYTAAKRSALVDGQGRPILIDGVAAGAQGFNDLRVDWLFSYRPSPGTLVYLGYGSSLAEPSAFAFGRDLRRVQDGFFGKVSWLFRR